VLGGVTVADQAELSVQRAQISSDGSLGEFQDVTSLQHASTLGSSVVIGSMLYVLDGGSLDVEAAAIDGDLVQSFAVVPELDVRADDRRGQQRLGAVTAVLGELLCVFGGEDLLGDHDVLRSVVCAALAPDGSVGPFAATAALATPLAGSASVAVGSRLYLIGGFSTVSQIAPLPSVIRIESTSGSSFAQLDEPALGSARQDGVSVVVGNSICAIAGTGEQAYMSSVECAAFAMSR
jgi:hypothetical protein